jgi:hypothetical protein
VKKTIKLSKTIHAAKRPQFKGAIAKGKTLKVPPTIAKAKQPKKGATVVTPVVDGALIVAGKTINAMALDEWKSGKQGMAALANKYGVKRGALKRAIVKAVGGKAKFKAMRDQGAGGTAEPFGGKRGVRVPVEVSDAKVPTVTRKQTKGWTSRSAMIGGVPTTVIIDANKVEYVPAMTNERADLIYRAEKCRPACDNPSCKGATLRLRRLETSGVVKKAKRKATLVAKGAKAHAVKRAAKRAKRAAKKGGK